MPEEVQTKTPVKRGPELGHDRWGGRKKRSASKARDIAESLGVDPIRWMLNLIKNGTYQQAVVDADGKKKRVTVAAPLDLLLDAARTTAQYLYPKLSSLAVGGGPDGDGPIEVVSLNITAIMNDPELAKQAQDMALALVEADAIQPRLPAPYAGLLADGESK